jgi:hypothetical protein
MDFATSYAAIIKQEKQEDGSLLVYGKATDDSVDMDQQICDSTWLDTAMPNWFKSGGNIREQHSNIAAGVAKEYEAKADGHYISALVVDPVSVKKVEAGVLKGFSIGIKSPRVVRDTKAVNGRIIDGQIIEVSLVDRPANPNAKLMLAKSVEGESSLVQVEELHEYKAPLPSDIAKFVEKTEKGSKMETIKQITELAKSLTPDAVKFDKDAFDAARTALANLIIVEAKEMATDGSNEKDSIEELLDAVKHLFHWYEGEVAEGEVVAPDLNTIELSVNAEIAKGGCDHEDSCAGCDCNGCSGCGGCDDKMCKGCKYMAKSATVEKCLECGCNKPADAHGRTDVTTAEMVSPDQTPKSVEADEVAEVLAEEVAAEEVAVEANPEVSEAPVVSDETSSIEEVVEKAVKSAMKSVESEIASLRAEKESAVEKSVKLEAELATALTKSVAGGPKRTATISGAQSNEYLVKAATYKAKADATTDAVLAKGYRALYAEFSAKGGLPVETDSE